MFLHISCLFLFFLNSLGALEQREKTSIEDIIHSYTEAWNERACSGFADSFTDDADFINIFGMHFTGRSEIEERHKKILESFLKGSVMHIENIKLREVQPGVVIALIKWKLNGFHNPGDDLRLPGETRFGIFSQLFIQSEEKWSIISSQNTLIK